MGFAFEIPFWVNFTSDPKKLSGFGFVLLSQSIFVSISNNSSVFIEQRQIKVLQKIAIFSKKVENHQHNIQKRT